MPGKKYFGKKRYCVRYSNIERGITGSSSSHLFYSPPPILKLNKCNSKRCLTCSNAFSSQCDNDPNLANFCKACCIIYKISCNTCNMPYIRETSMSLHLRINQHR